MPRTLRSRGSDRNINKGSGRSADLLGTDVKRKAIVNRTATTVVTISKATRETAERPLSPYGLTQALGYLGTTKTDFP